nr:MAG TPA: hypothetical protein [Caudoviricetes sp.]
MAALRRPPWKRWHDSTKLNKRRGLGLCNLASCDMGVPELIYSHFKKNKRR